MKSIEITPVYVCSYMPDDRLMKERHIYISLQYGVSIHWCLCGCKNKTVLPLHEENGWILTNNDGKISFNHSIGNYKFPCQSHYIINNNIATFV
jgi:hypothetical protein